MAAGRCKSAATSIGVRPRSLIMPGQLAAGGRFARALQAAHHQHGQLGLEMQRGVDRAHQVDQLLMDDADQLLAGIERGQHFFADGLLGDLGHEVLDDRVADVGFEQGLLHQGQPVAHVRFGELALAASGF